MSLSFDESVLAPAELPPGVTGFGSAELVYLLAQHETPAVEQTRQLLVPGVEGISDVSSPAFELVRAGASSLLARGLLQADDQRLVSKAEAAVLEYAAAQTHRWSRVLMVGEESARDIGVLLQAPVISVMLQPRGLGSWYAGFAQGEPSPAELVFGFVQALAQTHPEAMFSVDTWTLDTAALALFVRRGPDAEGWFVLDRADDPAADSVEQCDDGELTGRLAQVLHVSESQ